MNQPGWGERKTSRAHSEASFAPLGLVNSTVRPTAYAVGCILTPLRGSLAHNATA